MACYGALQEGATYTAYKVQKNRARNAGDRVLEAIFFYVGRDEAAHGSFPNATLVNVARGEIVDDDALLAALDQGKLRGVALDVYVGEFERPPDVRLWDDERVVMTPHVSAESDLSRHRGAFLRQPPRLSRRPAAGQHGIDWARGY
jgi:hypothetical protein